MLNDVDFQIARYEYLHFKIKLDNVLVSRAFRLAITLGVGLAVVSTIALIVVLVRHQKTIRKATREMQFQRLAANQFSGQYSDEPRGVEMDFVKGVKYDKLPIVS